VISYADPKIAEDSRPGREISAEPWSAVAQLPL
jgi:hypothetical protein